MSDMRKYTAADLPEQKRELTEDEVLASKLAFHFGYQVRRTIPAEEGYYSLSSHCVDGLWYRERTDQPWSCLSCASSYAFDSKIREDWLRQFFPIHC
jgi:hypothetical protein